MTAPRRRSGFRRALGALATAALAGCAVLGWRVATAPDPNLRFRHSVHVEQEGMACSDCHVAGAGGARYPRVGHDRCVRCHVGARDDVAHGPRCRTCHAEPFSAATLADARRYADIFTTEIRFDHAAHGDLACARCHGTVSSADGRGERHLPRMESCLTCHDADPAPAGPPSGCQACHETLGRDVRPADHHARFLRRHGTRADLASATCDRCHRSNECVDCHRTERPTDHSPRFERAAHGLAATRDRERCAVCHEANQCVTCHSQPPPNHSNRFMMRGAGPIDGTRHGRDAVRRPTACVACHDFASTCAKCH